MGAEGRVDWVQRPDGSRPWFHKSERTHSAKGNSSSDSSSSREAPDTAGNLGSVTPAQEMQKNAHHRDPCGLTSMVVASERGWGWLPPWS